jgi:hypothetical protein
MEMNIWTDRQDIPIVHSYASKERIKQNSFFTSHNILSYVWMEFLNYSVVLKEIVGEFAWI